MNLAGQTSRVHAPLPKTHVLQQTTDGITISVRRWSELIQEARGRLEFVQQELNYEVNRDQALERLRTTYAHILGGSEPAASSAPDDAGDEDENEDEGPNGATEASGT